MATKNEQSNQIASYNLEDVFKLSGSPTVTFVPPTEYGRLLVALRTPGRGVVVEGPSKIGKTTAVNRVLRELGLEDSAMTLKARKASDVEFIKSLPEMDNIGTVVIDDFHRLDTEGRVAISDYLKLLADQGDETSKIVIIGINKAGESLISLAPDLGGRIEIIQMGTNPDDSIERLVSQGEDALNVSIVAKSEIIDNSQGSFNIAQALCHDACLADDVHGSQSEHKGVEVPYIRIRERALDRMSQLFQKRAELFSKGTKLRKEGRAPYLQILRWLSQSDDLTIDLDREVRKHPQERASVDQVIKKGHLQNLLTEKSDELSELLHYDGESHVLSIEDPQFFFYIKNLPWNKFAQQLGYHKVSFESPYDYALSFAGEDRNVAQRIFDKLSEREMSVFYDHNQQSDILTRNVEEYLAPIYSSEAQYVVVLLGKEYPKKIWTKFESDHFRYRFGTESVIPIWFSDAPAGAFDASREYGGLGFDPKGNVGEQVDQIVEVLVARLKADRANPVAE